MTNYEYEVIKSLNNIGCHLSNINEKLTGFSNVSTNVKSVSTKDMELKLLRKENEELKKRISYLESELKDKNKISNFSYMIHDIEHDIAHQGKVNLGNGRRTNYG